MRGGVERVVIVPAAPKSWQLVKLATWKISIHNHLTRFPPVRASALLRAAPAARPLDLPWTPVLAAVAFLRSRRATG